MDEEIIHKSIPDSIGNTNFFTVPEGYFENLPARINKKLEGNISLKQTYSVVHKVFLRPLPVAAAIIGILIAVYAAVTFITRDHDPLDNKTLEISEVIDHHLNDIDDKMLYELYVENTQSQTRENSTVNESGINEMVEYLLYNDYDINLLLQELN